MKIYALILFFAIPLVEAVEKTAGQQMESCDRIFNTLAVEIDTRLEQLGAHTSKKDIEALTRSFHQKMNKIYSEKDCVTLEITKAKLGPQLQVLKDKITNKIRAIEDSRRR
mgnify:CR=1 FL=1